MNHSTISVPLEKFAELSYRCLQLERGSLNLKLGDERENYELILNKHTLKFTNFR